ncbi:hypothetical protein CXK92_12665 [Stutzerimonas stutzeri]|uniref:Lipoprotein n=2 Tax=Stutzerimonas stutzeri TaxID=316 RepID=A0A2N8S347_STUST|nr:hypothetical protein CXK92_12665 [Stutzerimonas stutzeri]
METQQSRASFVRFFGVLSLISLLAACQSTPPLTVKPDSRSRVAVMIDFDEQSRTVWIGNGFAHENIKSAPQPGWQLDEVLGEALMERLAADNHDYELRKFAGLGLVMRRRTHGGSTEGFITLPRAMTNPSIVAFAKPDLESNLKELFGLEYQALREVGTDYLVLLRQLPLVADPNSKDGSDRRILNSYGYYLKCDRTYAACEVPRALLRGVVEIVDLRQMRYVGGYGFFRNIPMPLDHNGSGEVSPEARALIDAHLKTLSLEIEQFLSNKGILGSRKPSGQLVKS